MKAPQEIEWSTKNVRACDADRADWLENCGSHEKLVSELCAALESAAKDPSWESLRIGIDSVNNAFMQTRAIVQLRVPTCLYDWFFNSRFGYRAAFFVDPRQGLDFNARAAKALADLMAPMLPDVVFVRKISVAPTPHFREDEDIGLVKMPRELILRSLEPVNSKIWIGERLLSTMNGALRDIGSATLIDAAKSKSKLHIPRWAEARNPKSREVGEGQRAPLPLSESSWLELKGGFFGADGISGQTKMQDERAAQISQYGWT